MNPQERIFTTCTISLLRNHRRYNITRAASWAPDCRKCLFSAVSGGIWTPHSPVLMISADKRPHNQLTVKNLFFIFNHQNILQLTPTYCSQKKQIIWVFEWRKFVHYWLHIICSRMQRVNLHARLSIIQVGCTTCCYQVCALDHAKGGTADLDYHSEPCHRNDFFFV